MRPDIQSCMSSTARFLIFPCGKIQVTCNVSPIVSAEIRADYPLDLLRLSFFQGLNRLIINSLIAGCYVYTLTRYSYLEFDCRYGRFPRLPSEMDEGLFLFLLLCSFVLYVSF